MEVREVLLQWGAAAVCAALFCRALWLSRPVPAGAQVRYRLGVQLCRLAAALATVMLAVAALRGEWLVAASWLVATVPALLAAMTIRRTALIHAQREDLYAQRSALQDQLSRCAPVDPNDTGDA